MVGWVGGGGGEKGRREEEGEGQKRHCAGSDAIDGRNEGAERTAWETLRETPLRADNPRVVDNIKSRYFIPQPPHVVRPKPSPAPLSSLFAFHIEGRNAWNDLLPALDRGGKQQRNHFYFRTKRKCQPSVKFRSLHTHLQLLVLPLPRISAQFTVTNFFKPTVWVAFAFKPTQLFCFFDDASMKSFSNSPPLSNYFVSSAWFSRYSFAPSVCPTRQYILRVISTSLSFFLLPSVQNLKHSFFKGFLFFSNLPGTFELPIDCGSSVFINTSLSSSANTRTSCSLFMLSLQLVLWFASHTGD